MRIFGLCIDGQTCRIQESSRLRTLIVEVCRPLEVRRIQYLLSSVLGSWYSFEINEGLRRRFNYQTQRSEVIIPPEDLQRIHKSRPIYLHLEFQNHEDAWNNFNVLDNYATNPDTDLRVSWVKDNWYWKVAKKAKSMNYRTTSKKKKL
jgi:hypothetical protein